MENLRIMAENLGQKKEIISNFVKIGYIECECCDRDDNDLMGIHVYSGGCIQDVLECDFFDNDHREITLPQLRDMVKPKAKEYIAEVNGEWRLVESLELVAGRIEVPKGAEILTIILGDKVFYKSGSPFQWFSEEQQTWFKCSDAVDWDGFNDALWKRESITETEYLTQGENGARLNESIEQLRANAKTETLNDKVASAEVARQDNVNNPKHYTSDPSGIECIEITRHRNFNIGNAIKYLWRNGLKDSDSQIQDLEKAIWYIQDEIKRLSK